MSHKLLSDPQPQESSLDRPLYTPIKRRSFFMYAGATAGATALVLAGCSKDDDNASPSGTVNVGSGDVGVLNYAYALEQLEAGFYTTLRTGKYYTGLQAGTAEKQILDDLYYHEVIHRDFFKAALTATPGATVIPSLTPNFSSINFDDRMSVLSTAKAFEDLGVAAYNGAGRFIKTPAYLVIAGKIVSVEARHAAIVRDLLQEATFVGNDILTISEGSSLERSKLPSVVVATANSFLADGSKLDVSGLG